MDEVFKLADRMTVLRDGAHIRTVRAEELKESQLISLMVGRELVGRRVHARTVSVECVLSVSGLSRDGAFQNVSFELKRGEVLGLAGLMGAGRSEVACALFGLSPADSGEIRVRGRQVRIRRPSQAMGLGIGMVTEDRRGYGLVPLMSVRHNITLSALHTCCWGPFIRPVSEDALSARAIAECSIKASHPDQAVSQLSGGNQQKVVIARTLLPEPEIVILDEPTRGIDIGAKAEVYAIIAKLAGQGRAVLLISSELPELLAVCDRLLVMRQGLQVAELDPSKTSQEEILKYAIPI